MGFYFKIPRHIILNEMDLEELTRYHTMAMYYHLESLGRKVDKPTREQDREFEKERQARLKKQYGYTE